ncbi:unnamed protein product, partial [Prorocentrum cordatum]
ANPDTITFFVGATMRYPYHTKLEGSLAHGTTAVNEGDEVTIFIMYFNGKNELWARGTIAQVSNMRSSKQALIAYIIIEYRSHCHDILEKFYNTVVGSQKEIASANDTASKFFDKLNEYVTQLRP